MLFLFKVAKITLNNTFAIPLLRINGSVKCLDLSCNRDKLAVIDESNTLSVHSVHSKEILFRVSAITNYYIATQFLLLVRYIVSILCNESSCFEKGVVE